MTRRGPRTKPTKLKLLSGTAPPHRLNADHLTHAALAARDRIVAELVTLALLTNLDRGALAAYCQVHGRWSAAETALGKMARNDRVSKSPIVKTKSGNITQNPCVGAATKAMADVGRYAAEFGLTPSPRNRVSATGSDTEDDPFAIFDERGG